LLPFRVLYAKTWCYVQIQIEQPGKLIRESNTIKIPVALLEIGMYISKLDRPWLDTPFLFQGFQVNCESDIDTVKQFCEYVYIDAIEERWQRGDTRTTGLNSRKQCYIKKVSFEQEQHTATGVYTRARSITKSLLDEVRLGNAINTQQVKDTVGECVDSIIRNPDALMWLTQIKNKDEYTAEHCLNVCLLSVAFARHLGLPKEDILKIGFCALLHDVGKMKTPLEVLNKEGALNQEEFEIMKRHAQDGRDILITQSDIYHGAVDVAYGHHERLDGRGYPRGLKANSIGSYTRIIAITDTYDAITSDRVYCEGKSSLEALRIIYSSRKSQFDPHLAINFIQCIGLYPPGSIVELRNGQIGVVLTMNLRNRRLPKVLLARDSDQKSIAEEVVDLAKIVANEDSDMMIKKVHRDGSFGIKLADYRARGLAIDKSH